MNGHCSTAGSGLSGIAVIWARAPRSCASVGVIRPDHSLHFGPSGTFLPVKGLMTHDQASDLR